jgi:hypothetical protein
MKPSFVVAILLAIAAFGGLVVAMTLQGSEVECEICLTFPTSGEVCRQGRGPTEEEARLAAQQSVCGGNAMGMAESIACLSRTAERSSCAGG